MLLLNHLRNSTRDDIRNPVKTVLNYLNSFDVSGVYVPTSAHPSKHDTLPLNCRFDGNLKLVSVFFLKLCTNYSIRKLCRYVLII